MKLCTITVFGILFLAVTPLSGAGPMGTQIGSIQGQWLNSGRVYGPQEEIRAEAELINTSDFVLIGFTIELNSPLPPGFTFSPGPGPGDTPIAPAEKKTFTAFKVKLPSPPTFDDSIILVFDEFASFRTFTPRRSSDLGQATNPAEPYVLVNFPDFIATVISVPTPAPLPLLGIGALALGARFRRRRR